MRPEKTTEQSFALADLLRLGPAALAVGVIIITLAAKGANTPPAAALMSVALLGALAWAAFAAAPKTLDRVVQEHRISLVALAGFFLWTIFTTIPLSPPLTHPAHLATGRIGGPISIAPYRAFETLVMLLGPIAAFAVGALAVERSADRDVVGRVLLAGMGFFLAWALVEHGLTGNQRLDAGLGSANVAATVFGIAVLLAMTMAARIGRKRRRGEHGLAASLRSVARAPASLTILTIALTCLLLSASRGGAVATLAAVLMLVGLGLIGGSERGFGQRFAGVGKTGLAVGVLILILTMVGAQFTLERFATDNVSASSRLPLLAAHWEAFLDRPFLGHGLGGFQAINLLYATPENWESIQTAGAAHNVVLQFLEESGLIGATLFGIAMLAPVGRALAAAFTDPSGRAWSACAAAATCLVFLHGMVDISLNAPAVMALYGFCLGAFCRRALSRG